ncbi:S-layer homology domain-containing protein [Pseudanabaena biceps]|nr:S-layer homology domain-containing protein [Pseudanabaena biceps]
MKIKKTKLRKLSRIITTGLLCALVGAISTSCQGSNLGSSLESAIAPASPPINSSDTEAIANPKTQPQAFITPPASPTISTGSNKNSDRLIPQMQAIALASLKAEKFITSEPKAESLKSLFYIDFSDSASPVITFSDLNTAPAPLRDWIKDLNQLGTIAPKTGQEFKPNILVARREYARWLLETNNRLYKNQPSRQIRLAQPTDNPSFVDVPKTHPDFAIIQGLANAGLINSSSDRFSPNDPLSREELVQWKIPLDLRQPLPRATLDNIRQAWGFQDSDRVSENALSAIFADAQLRDLSNIRRSFGFTTLLQPQKPVTRAEAAASLWYFGTATDGISASKALKLDR